MMQRMKKGFYKKERLSPDEFKKYMEKWLGSSSNFSSKTD